MVEWDESGVLQIYVAAHPLDFFHGWKRPINTAGVNVQLHFHPLTLTMLRSPTSDQVHPLPSTEAQEPDVAGKSPLFIVHGSVNSSTSCEWFDIIRLCKNACSSARLRI